MVKETTVPDKLENFNSLIGMCSCLDPFRRPFNLQGFIQSFLKRENLPITTTTLQVSGRSSISPRKNFGVEINQAAMLVEYNSPGGGRRDIWPVV
jgi:hypothetical protein